MSETTTAQLLQDAEARIREVEKSLSTLSVADKALSEPATRLDEDRSWITRLVLRIFATAVGVYLLFLLVQGIVPGASTAIAGKAEDMIRTIIVPVVTLVLGYYFGQSGKG